MAGGKNIRIHVFMRIYIVFNQTRGPCKNIHVYNTYYCNISPYIYVSATRAAATRWRRRGPVARELARACVCVAFIILCTRPRIHVHIILYLYFINSPLYYTCTRFIILKFILFKQNTVCHTPRVTAVTVAVAVVVVCPIDRR